MQNKIYIALAAALAMGSASAQTVAGTTITNTATASYESPTAPGTTVSTNSNTVETVVLPQPSFDIVYTDGTPDSGTQNAIGTTTKVYSDVQPGQVIETPYTIINNGNVALDVNVAADEDSTGGTVTYYYANPDGTRGAAITGPVALPVDDPTTTVDEGQVNIIQVVTVATTATSDTIVGASPEGTVVGTGVQTDPSTGAYTGGNGIPTGGTLYEEQTVANGAIVATPAAETDLQFIKINVYTPQLINTPETGTENNPLTTTTPPTLPAGTTPAPTTNPNTGQPNVIEINGDEQLQRVPESTQPGTAIFENTVVNGGTLADPVNLFPVGPDGVTPWAYDPATGVFTSPDGTTTVRLLDPVTGQPLPTGDDGFPTLTVAPNGGTGTYITEITYPATTTFTDPLQVVIGVDSGLDSNNTPDNLTTDTILPPAAQFGNPATGVAADPAPTDPQVANPGTTTTHAKEIANIGEYPESYTVSGYVIIQTTTGPVTVPVIYEGLTQTGTTTAPDGTVIPVYTTPVVAEGTEIPFNATVAVPANALSGSYTLQQTAEGTYSGITMTDNNDLITVSPVGNVALAKFQEGATGAALAADGTPLNIAPIANPPAGYGAGIANAAPGATINYQIIAKNNFNAPVNNFLICDTAPLNTTFVSISDTDSIANIYRINGGAWTTTAPAAGTAGEICIANDSDGNLVPDTLAAGATYTVNFSAQVN